LAAGAAGFLDVAATKAGSLAGNVSVALTSNANSVAGLSNVTLPGQLLAVTGAAYDYATATVASSLALGNVRVGDLRNLAVTNTVGANGVAAYQDNLAVAATTANAKLTLGNPATIAAGATGNVTLTAAAAGTLAGTTTLALTSQALTGTGLTDLSLDAQSTAITGAAYDYANANVSTANVAFGYIHVGAAAVSRNITIQNQTITSAAYQDKLAASVSQTLSGVTNTTIADIAAGATSSIVLTAATGTARSLAGNIELSLTSTSAISGLDAKVFAAQTLAATGQVYTGQSIWSTNGNGAWGTVSAGFGANWGANQGSAGLDAGFTNVDAATFNNLALTAGNSAIVSLNGAAPSLKALTFNTAGGGYTLATGTSGSLRLASDTGTATVTATAGTHVVSTAIALANAVTVTVAANSLEFAGILSGSGLLTKDGAGSLTLSGSNTFTGGVVLNAGTLVAKNMNGLGLGNVVVNAGTLDLFGNSVANLIQVYGGSVINSGVGSLSTSALEVDSTSNVTISANLSGSSSLTKKGAGALTMTGTNTFSGGMDIQAGTIYVGASSAVGSSVNALAIRSGATVDLSGHDIAIGALTNGSAGQGGAVVNSGDAATLTLNTPALATFGGSLTGDISLVKAGAGSQALTSANLTYTGTTSITGGSLDFTKAGVLSLAGAGTGEVTVANGAAINFFIGGAGDFTLAEVLDTRSGENFEAGAPGVLLLLTLGQTALVGVNTTHASAPLTYTGNIGETDTFRGFAKSGAGTLILTGANNYTGNTLVTLSLIHI
jgi:fibronectin-binding autotransporter adhesin